MILSQELATVVKRWLANEDGLLKTAVEETISSGYFSRPDIVFALRSLRETVSEITLEKWIEGKSPVSNPKNVLVLHAGNLPLVGFQDILAVLLSGHRYHGKLSRKDPFLAASFLNFAKKAFPESIGHFSADAKTLSIQHDALVFSGSELSAPEVLHWLEKNGLLKPQAPKLLRTAQFSVAYVDEMTEENMPYLTEAMLRYGGKGCRSVAIIVCPKPLKSNSCSIVDHTEAFWVGNPGAEKNRMTSVYHAYYRASGFPLTLVDHFMLVETQPDPSIPNTVFYVRGGAEKVGEIMARFAGKIQTVYTEHEAAISGISTELLKEAQKPPVYWKPDGVDTLNWLCSL